MKVERSMGAAPPSENPITMRIGCLPWLPDSIFQRQLKYGVASKFA
jgi:hypothetical protein